MAAENRRKTEEEIGENVSKSHQRKIVSEEMKAA